MQRQLAVTVAIPAYQGQRFLAAAIASVLSQTYRDFELIIVDDGSTDGSADIIRSAACTDARVVPVFRPHGGIAAAMNVALAKARGRYFAPMDQDDLSHPKRLAHEVAFLEANPDIAVVGTAWETFEAKTKTTIPPTAPRDVASAMHQRCVVMHPSSMMRTDFIRSIGGYRVALPYGHDSDLWLRVLENGQMANIPDVLLRKRKHKDQVTSSRRDSAARVAASGIIYLSHLSRRYFGEDFITGRESLIADSVRFFHRFLREVDERDPAIYRHLNRFMRYVSLKGTLSQNDGAIPRHPYWRYLTDEFSRGPFLLAIRGACYAGEFLLFNQFVEAAGRGPLPSRREHHHDEREDATEGMAPLLPSFSSQSVHES